MLYMYISNSAIFHRTVNIDINYSIYVYSRDVDI